MRWFRNLWAEEDCGKARKRGAHSPMMKSWGDFKRLKLYRYYEFDEEYMGWKDKSRQQLYMKKNR